MLMIYTINHLCTLVSGLPVPDVGDKLLAPQNFMLFHIVNFWATFQIFSSPSSEIFTCGMFYADSDSLGCAKSNVLSNF
jgi:hypothetical protein